MVLVQLNFNRIELDAWIERRRLADGSYELVGMGRHTEYDAKTGEIVSDKIEPTGVRGTAPHDAFGECRTIRQWLCGVFMWPNVAMSGAARHDRSERSLLGPSS